MRLGCRSWGRHRCGPSWSGLAPGGLAGRIVVQEVLHGICTRPRTHRHGLDAADGFGFGGEGFAPAGASSAGQHQPRTFAETALAACPSRIGLRPSGTGIHRLYRAWPRVVGQTIQRSGLAPAPNGERAMAPGKSRWGGWVVRKVLPRAAHVALIACALSREAHLHLAGRITVRSGGRPVPEGRSRRGSRDGGPAGTDIASPREVSRTLFIKNNGLAPDCKSVAFERPPQPNQRLAQALSPKLRVCARVCARDGQNRRKIIAGTGRAERPRRPSGPPAGPCPSRSGTQRLPDGQGSAEDQSAVDAPEDDFQRDHAAISFRSRERVEREQPVALIMLAQLCPFRSMVLSASFRSESAGRPR